MPTREPEPQVPIGFRLPAQLVARIDAYADKVRESLAGHRINRSDAIRVLLEKALAAEGFPAAEAKPAKRK
jgi:Arc/MetJ-type ribon-helix-helix transcriptional regulator